MTDPAVPMTETLCILTDWPKDAKGYGVKYVRGTGRTYRAHRWAWEQARGPIPIGMVVMHLCDNPPCVNVEHLRVGTHADNIADRDAKGRTATGDRNGSTHRRGVPRIGRSAPKPGESNGRSKLTAADVEAMRRLHDEGHGMRGLGRMYGVSARQVGRIVKRERWTDV